MEKMQGLRGGEKPGMLKSTECYERTRYGV